MNPTAITTAEEVFGSGLSDIVESISSEIDTMPGGTADFTPAATHTPCALALSIAIMC